MMFNFLGHSYQHFAYSELELPTFTVCLLLIGTF